MNCGLVSARHVDHVGMTVPNLDEAIQFLEGALGAKLLWRVGPFHETPTGVPIKNIENAMLRLGPNLNVEAHREPALPTEGQWGWLRHRGRNG